jgi:hypothetical protein
MRGRISLVGAIARGLAVFTAMTASLALALFIAITGPPSNDEMAGLRAAGDAALAKFEEGTRALGDAVCAQLPTKWKIAAECPGAETEVAQAKSEPPPVVPLPPDTIAPQPPVQIAETHEPDAPLLGGATQPTAARVRAAPVRVVVRAPRPHAARAPHRTARHPPSPRPQRITTHTPPHRQPPHATTPVRAPPVHETTPVHTTPVVAPAQTPPPAAEPTVAVPHPQLAAPEPQVAAAPSSAAPPDSTPVNATPSATDPPLEKHDPDQAQTF